jgi:hypothetical protein
MALSVRNSKQPEVDSKPVFPWTGPPDRSKSMDRIRDELEGKGQKPVAEVVGTGRSHNEAGTWIRISISKRRRKSLCLSLTVLISRLDTTPDSQHYPDDKYTLQSRYLSPDSTSDQSDAVYYPPSPQIDHDSHRYVGKNRQIITISPTSVKEIPHICSPPNPSLPTRQAIPSGLSTAFTVGVQRQMRTKASPRGKARRSKGGRMGESRRIQNMTAQKKYRDKRVQTAELVSNPFCRFQCILISR